MPLRSLNSSVLEWPDLASVDQAVRFWAEQQAQSCPEILQVGYFGSYGRGDWGVGSDLDLVIIVKSSETHFWQRSLEFDALNLPVPVDLLVYTQDEWQSMRQRGDRFPRQVEAEVVWVYLSKGGSTGY